MTRAAESKERMRWCGVGGGLGEAGDLRDGQVGNGGQSTQGSRKTGLGV